MDFNALHVFRDLLLYQSGLRLLVGIVYTLVSVQACWMQIWMKLTVLKLLLKVFLSNWADNRA